MARSRPAPDAANTLMIIVRVRPIRSATAAHGNTDAATPSVAADTVVAAAAAPTCISRLIAGRIACASKSWAKVANPAANNATVIRVYSRDPRSHPDHTAADEAGNGCDVTCAAAGSAG
ncbi:MAG: hypothetical protein QM673_13175 [Gordonia sp. (in: high G+C Gram-positive bacteria)]